MKYNAVYREESGLLSSVLSVVARHKNILKMD